ncbi:MAG: tetratricopeptide repeat-containing glycosyltransferase family protein [Burkholderiales bacterium]|nr:tetratricopeptide repeat-containing glycosyltransferase family protein [Burkholderiales bacterium]
MLRKLLADLVRGPRRASAPPATAEADAARLADARRLLAAGDARAALAVIAPQAARADAGGEALHLYGQALAQTGATAEALTALRRAASLADSAALRADLGNVLLLAGDLDAAEAEYRRSLAIDPHSAGAWHNLGLLEKRRGRLEAAARCFLAALDAAPESAAALVALGSIAPRFPAIADETRARCTALVAARPHAAAAHEVLGFLKLKQDLDAEGAAASFERAIANGGGSSDLHGNLGIALQDLGRVPEAIAAYDRAIALDPGNTVARWHRSLALLLVERFAEAWPEYELRLASEERPRRPVPVPRWTEAAPPAGRLLVVAEQGLGDEIMFASCIPDLVRAGARVVLEANPKLAPIFRRSFPGVDVRAGTQDEPLDWAARAAGIERYIEAGSLPLRFRATREAFPRHSGYLAADADKVRRWRERLDALGGRAIGLSWRGGTEKSRRRLRSPELAELAPLLALPDIQWVSLQYDAKADEIAALARASGGRLHHWQEAIDDYDETAALVCALDRTVTVCTAIVHLAGALGRPVIVMAPYSPEWRYGLTAERMPWYPSVRVLRQPARYAWGPLLERVKNELAPAGGLG